MLGLAIRIHEIVMITPGMMMRPRVTRPISRASGVLVRSTVHARNVPADKSEKSRRQRKVERIDTRLPKLADAVGTAIVGQRKAEIQKPCLAGAYGFETRPNDQRQRHCDLVEQDDAEANQNDAAAA